MKKGKRLYNTIVMLKCNVDADSLLAAKIKTINRLQDIAPMMDDDIGIDNIAVVYVHRTKRQ